MATSDNSEPRPWRRELQLHEKPEGVEYGYFLSTGERQRLQPCSREQLIEFVTSSGRNPLVIVPEVDTPVPASFISWLNRDHRKAAMKGMLKEALLNGAFLAVILAVEFRDGDFSNPSIITVILGLMIGVSFVRSLYGAAKLAANVGGDPVKRMDGLLFQEWFTARKSKVPLAFIGAFALTFLAQIYLGYRVDEGQRPFMEGMRSGIMLSADALGMAGDSVRQGEWYRVFTCAFLHGGLLHIGFNSLAFYMFGIFVLRLAHWSLIPIIFLVTVVTGSLFGMWLSPVLLNTEVSVSVGASGGVLGLFGFTMVLALRYRKLLPKGIIANLFLNVVLIAALGWFGREMIDNGAHLGGFLGGVLLGVPLFLSRKHWLPYEPTKAVQIVGYVFCVLFALAALFTAAVLMGWIEPSVLAQSAGHGVDTVASL